METIFISIVDRLTGRREEIEVSAVGALVLSLAPGVPVSVFVASISF